MTSCYPTVNTEQDEESGSQSRVFRVTEYLLWTVVSLLGATCYWPFTTVLRYSGSSQEMPKMPEVRVSNLQILNVQWRIRRATVLYCLKPSSSQTRSILISIFWLTTGHKQRFLSVFESAGQCDTGCIQTGLFPAYFSTPSVCKPEVLTRRRGHGYYCRLEK